MKFLHQFFNNLSFPRQRWKSWYIRNKRKQWQRRTNWSSWAFRFVQLQNQGEDSLGLHLRVFLQVFLVDLGREVKMVQMVNQELLDYPDLLERQVRTVDLEGMEKMHKKDYRAQLVHQVIFLLLLFDLKMLRMDKNRHSRSRWPVWNTRNTRS